MLPARPRQSHRHESARDVPETYRIFDISVSSELPLPELPVAGEGEAAVRIVVLKPGQASPRGYETRHQWLDDNGVLICRSSRKNGEYMLFFPQQATFFLSQDGVIRCMPGVDTPAALLRHLLLNQVIPRYMAHCGELLLHASAVVLPGGSSVAFLGETGRGKSTLASYCARQGAQLIDDDCVRMRFAPAGITVSGGVPTIRLYPDSLHALGYSAADFSSYVEYTDKVQQCLPRGSCDPAGGRPLHTLYLLEEPPSGKGVEMVSVAPATVHCAVMAAVGSAFVLDPSERETMARTLSAAAKILSGGLPVCHLRYPRDHSKLALVYRTLLEQP